MKDAAAMAWVAHASRVLVSASRRNNLPSARYLVESSKEKFAIARTQSPARETRALPRLATSHAFTILELLVVLTIIIVLAGLILATSGYVQNKGARSRTEVEIAAISAALENYKADNGVYPSNDDTRALDPATTSPDSYRSASSYLYSQLTGDEDANPITPAPPDAKNYFGSALKPNLLAPNPSGPHTYLQDPFRNSYGYSTAKAENPAGDAGHNPTFDLWSTANSANPSQWIKNW